MTPAEAIAYALRILAGADRLVASGLYGRDEANDGCRGAAHQILAEVAR